MEKQKQLRTAYYRAMNFAAPFDGQVKDAIIRMRMRDYSLRKKMDFSAGEIDSVICGENRKLSQLLQPDWFRRSDPASENRAV